MKKTPGLCNFKTHTLNTTSLFPCYLMLTTNSWCDNLSCFLSAACSCLYSDASFESFVSSSSHFSSQKGNMVLLKPESGILKNMNIRKWQNWGCTLNCSQLVTYYFFPLTKKSLWLPSPTMSHINQSQVHVTDLPWL